MTLFFYLSDAYIIGMLVWMIAGGIALVGLLRLRRRRKSRGWQRCLNASLACWMVMALLTAGELGFALFYDTTDAFNLTNVSQRWMRVHDSPDRKAVSVGGGAQIVYRDNALFPESVPESQHHILFTGDSFTVGHGIADVEDRFSNQIRHELESMRKGRFVVSNLSDAGRDLFWVNMVMTRLLEAGHRVDTVIYVLCLNDIETFSDEYQEFYGKLSDTNPKFFLFRDTYLLNFLYFRVMQFRLSEVVDYYALLTSFYSGEPWERMSVMLSRLNERCRSHNAELRIVVFPFLHDTDDQYDCSAAHEAVMDFCRGADIRAVDLAEDLLPHLHEGLTVNAFDAHPNERAHELAAQAILEKLLNDLYDAD